MYIIADSITKGGSEIVTRRDVATKAGVSTATVSRVMNDYPNVSNETRKKVQKVIEKLDYKPNHIARGLKTNRSYNIVFLIPDISNDFYTEIYKGICDYALTRGYIVSLYELNNSNSLFESILQLRPDGIILGVDISQKTIKMFKSAGIPIVAIGGIINKYIKLKISIDLYQSMVEVIDYLFKIGHRNIGFITYQNKKDERYRSFVDAFSRRSIVGTEKIIPIIKGNNHYEQGYFAMKEFSKTKISFTAIIAHNDLLAVGAMKSLNELGLKIPEDISLIAFDDTRTAKYTNPPLSSVRIPKYRQGEMVAELLFNYLNNKKNNVIEMKTKLILRDSIKTLS